MTTPTPAPDAGEQDVLETLGRAGVYRLLGAALAYPWADRLPATAALARAAIGSAPAEIAGPLDRLAGCADTADPAALAQEHVFLFDRAVRCSPYEGAWSEGPHLAGKAALLADVAGFYAAFGMSPADRQPDTEDHIAAECEFMSALLVKEAWAHAHGEAERREIAHRAAAAFVADHLGRWALAFAAALRESTTLPYYGVVAELLEAWIAGEIGRLGVAPSPVSARSGGDPLLDADRFTCPMAPDEPPEAPG